MHVYNIWINRTFYFPCESRRKRGDNRLRLTVVAFSFRSFSFLLLTVQYDAMWVEWRQRKMKRRGRKIAKQQGMEKNVESIRRAIIIIICRNRNVFREFSVCLFVCRICFGFSHTDTPTRTQTRQRDGKICCCNCMRWMRPWSFIKFITHLDVWVRTSMWVPVCVCGRERESKKIIQSILNVTHRILTGK